MRLMKSLLPVMIAVLLGVPSAAVAETRQVDDPAGDGFKGRRLDITHVAFANRDHAIVVRVSFVRATHGDLAVWLHARGDRRRTITGMVSEHRARGDRNRVLTRTGDETCQGLTATWDHADDVARLRLPSRCFRGGDYGAVRARFITEIGSDADLHWQWTDWTSRG